MSNNNLTLDYNQVYSTHRAYTHFYTDLLGNTLKNNISVAYVEMYPGEETPVLSLGVIVLKDHTFPDKSIEDYSEITLLKVPHIRAKNGSLIINTGINCIPVN